MNKILIGLLTGVLLTTVIFLIKDFFTIQTKVPKGHVTVRLLFNTEKPIDKLTLVSTYSSQTIELSGQSETVLIFPSPGEGEFKICCTFQDGEELCSKGDYVEANYAPILKIGDNTIETVSFF